jgi:hypothetical protein
MRSSGYYTAISSDCKGKNALADMVLDGATTFPLNDSLNCGRIVRSWVKGSGNPHVIWFVVPNEAVSKSPWPLYKGEKWASHKGSDYRE